MNTLGFYLRGISTGDLGAPNLSPSVISRLTGQWQHEDNHWQRRDLSARRYVYMWIDGVYSQERMFKHGNLRRLSEERMTKSAAFA